MDEIFSGWLRSEAYAKEIKEQSDTLVLTWTPYISRWTALKIVCCGGRRGRTNIATIKVLVAHVGGAMLRVCQQPDFETTETQLMESLAKGRSVDLDHRLATKTS